MEGELQRQETPVELALLHRLESAYIALGLASQDSVVVPNPDFDPVVDDPIVGCSCGTDSFDVSKVFFNAADDHGEEIVRERIRTAGDDIREALRMHDIMCGDFRVIDEALKRGERDTTVENIGYLCDRIDNYGRFVKGHKERLKEASFLLLPRYEGGSISYRKGPAGETAIYSLQPFNPIETQSALSDRVIALRELLGQFNNSREPLWTGIYTGHRDDTYVARIDLTKMLLKEHLGFDVDSK